MRASRLAFLVEEPSMEVFLRGLLPNVIPHVPFQIHVFQGKRDMLSKLGDRLRGYARWLPQEHRLFVMVDRDQGDCHKLKRRLEDIATKAGLRTRTNSAGTSWQLVNRVVIEELEAWYFGDWRAVRKAYPKMSETIPQKASYRNSDAIKGGTWEAFERVMRQRNYFVGGLRKVEAAHTIAPHIDPTRNQSPSFKIFHEAIVEATA